MIQSDFERSERNINAYFRKLDGELLSKRDIENILWEQRNKWGLDLSTQKFIDQLKELHLQEIEFSCPTYGKSYIRYVWGKRVPFYRMCLSLKTNAYFSHHSAMYIHGLTDKKPEIIYVNAEQSAKQRKDSVLEQSRIDAAFRRKARTSQYIFSYNDRKICLLSGTNTNNLGVIDQETAEGEIVPVTNVERTLIDIVVRPFYAGGAKEILNAYKAGKDKVSAKKLVSMLKKINYAYPYHQAIGFYMERSNFDTSSLNLLKKIGIKYNFYLDYNMKGTEYSQKWKIYFPKGL
jgi:predicted transcriptional regulator of viral defense system